MKKNFYKTQKRTTQSINNFSLLSLLICMSTFNLTAADTAIYGKINLDVLTTEADSKSSSETNSNASRLGYKAKFKLTNKVNFLCPQFQLDIHFPLHLLHIALEQKMICFQLRIHTLNVRL